jgi:hypothetical protein
MKKGCSLVWLALVGLFRSRVSLLAEILVLRHQLNIQRRRLPKRQTFSSTDHLIFVTLYRFVPTVINALAIVKPETVIKWHRGWVQIVLALEVTTPWWQACCAAGGPPADPRDEHCKFVAGRTADPRSAA